MICPNCEGLNITVKQEHEEIEGLIDHKTIRVYECEDCEVMFQTAETVTKEDLKIINLTPPC